jgi:hypothetical protein
MDQCDFARLAQEIAESPAAAGADDAAREAVAQAVLIRLNREQRRGELDQRMLGEIAVATARSTLADMLVNQRKDI